MAAHNKKELIAGMTTNIPASFMIMKTLVIPVVICFVVLYMYCMPSPLHSTTYFKTALLFYCNDPT